MSRRRRSIVKVMYMCDEDVGRLKPLPLPFMHQNTSVYTNHSEIIYSMTLCE
jgi:hypothetical protein